MDTRSVIHDEDFTPAPRAVHDTARMRPTPVDVVSVALDSATLHRGYGIEGLSKDLTAHHFRNRPS